MNENYCSLPHDKLQNSQAIYFDDTVNPDHYLDLLCNSYVLQHIAARFLIKIYCCMHDRDMPYVIVIGLTDMRRGMLVLESFLVISQAVMIGNRSGHPVTQILICEFYYLFSAV